MKSEFYNRKAQSTMEWTMTIVILAAALFAMQVYIKRGLQGRFKDAADEIGEQYSASKTTSSMTQIITNPSPVVIIGKPKFISVNVTDPVTNVSHIEDREIIEVTRSETTDVTIGGGSYEQTDTLSSEELFSN